LPKNVSPLKAVREHGEFIRSSCGLAEKARDVAAYRFRRDKRRFRKVDRVARFDWAVSDNPLFDRWNGPKGPADQLLTEGN